MLEWYLEVNAVFRAMRQKAIDAQGLLASDDTFICAASISDDSLSLAVHQIGHS